MHKYVSIVFLVILLGVSCSSNTLLENSNGDVPQREASTISWGEAWNNHCTANGFLTNQSVTIQTTLGDLYIGADFARDIHKMDLAISADIGAPSGLDSASIDLLYMWFDSDTDGGIQ